MNAESITLVLTGGLNDFGSSVFAILSLMLFTISLGYLVYQVGWKQLKKVLDTDYSGNLSSKKRYIMRDGIRWDSWE